MWELRLILFLIGVVFIAAVYLLSRQRKSRTDDFHRAPPTLKESNLPDLPSDSAAGPSISPMRFSDSRPLPVASSENSEPEPESKQLILALHVACREQNGFAGEDVLSALQSAGLHYGQYHVFHRLIKTDMWQSIFSVANMVEPGVLDLDALPEMRIPGLTLFLVLPGPLNGVAACADMLATARTLAQKLDGDVLDDTRNVLTTEAAQRIRERILEFQRRVSDQ